MSERTCSVDPCERRDLIGEWCGMHYQRHRRNGSMEPLRPGGRRGGPKVAPCKVDGCEALAGLPGTGRGWCASHYRRWKIYGDPLGAHQPTVGIAQCSIDDCAEVVQARGWCTKHYTRWVRFGDPEARPRGEVVDGRRICPGCREDKPLDAYTPGSTGGCRTCAAVKARERRKDPEVQRTIREYSQRYKEANPGVQAERARSWRRRNPEQVRAATAKRRALRMAAAVEDFTPHEIFERDGWVCGICQEQIPPSVRYPDPLSASLDHIVPLSRSGQHERANCQAAHLICNVRKGPRAS